MKLWNVWRLGAVVLFCGLMMTVLPVSLSKAAERASSSHYTSNSADPDQDFDRLDGTGASHETVQVIEWEGNLEIHVYPEGSLKGLALTIDRKNKGRPVMVIGYRFNNHPDKQLIRRAIIDGLHLHDHFHVYRDATADGYDKIVITNNILAPPLFAFNLDPKPKQLYPDGHPALLAKGGTSSNDTNRSPASLNAGDDSTSAQARENKKELEDSGTIHSVWMNEGRHGL